MIDICDISTGHVTVMENDRDERLFKQLHELKVSHNPALRDRPQWILLKGDIARWIIDEFREVEEETMVHDILKINYDIDRDIWTDGAVVCLDVDGKLCFAIVSEKEKVRSVVEPLSL